MELTGPRPRNSRFVVIGANSRLIFRTFARRTILAINLLQLIDQASRMSATLLAFGNMFECSSEELAGPVEILVEDDRNTSIGRSVNRPPAGAGNRPFRSDGKPGFIDTHVHLTMDAANPCVTSAPQIRNQGSR